MHRRIRRLFCGIALSAIVACIAPGPVCARTWVVATDGSGDFTTIQDAIDAAASDGDRIEVHPGLYDENLNLRGKVVDLTGVSGADATVVDGGERRGVLEIPFTGGGSPRIEGLTFTNGIGKIVRGPLPDGRFGGGIFIEVAAPEFVECVIAGNRADAGGGVYVLSGSPHFLRCAIRDNAAGTGGGVALHVDRGARFEDCTIAGNTSVFGGGIATFQARGVFERCRITGNTASEGAALRALDTDFGGERVRLAECLVARNYGDWGSGILLEDASVEVRSTTIAGNEGYGAVVETWNGDLILIDTIVERRDSGQLAVCTGAATVEIDCVIVHAPGAGVPDCMQGPTVLDEDPLFCNPENGDYHVLPESPALPGQGPPGCGLIGVYGALCDEPVAVQPSGWGRLRAMWRDRPGVTLR